MRFWKHKHKWKAIRTICYKDGYGVYCKGCRTVLEQGLPKWEAELAAKGENFRQQRLK